MKPKKKPFPPQNDTYYKSDGSDADDDSYCVSDYMDFISNGYADNEKIEASEYFDDYLSEDDEE